MHSKMGLPVGGVAVRGRFRWQIVDANGRVTDSGLFNNAAVTAGLNYLLEAGFRGGTQVTTWYVSLINASGYSAIAAADTMSSHAGWAEWTGYNEANRQTWSPGAASSGSVVNATVMTFTNSSGSAVSVKGMFVTSSNTKGGTTGTLWATAVDDTARTLANGSTFQVIYEIDLTPQS